MSLFSPIDLLRRMFAVIDVPTSVSLRCRKRQTWLPPQISVFANTIVLFIFRTLRIQFEITEENGPDVLKNQCLGYVSVQMYDHDRQSLKLQSPAPFPLPSLTLLYSDLTLKEE
jgi:hypothetical protein